MFQVAKRRNLKLRLALTGPAGAGKTLGALKVAAGLVGPNGKIAVIDTENGTSEAYADKFNFQVVKLSAPFLISKYLEAIEAATKGGFDVLVIDSLSHAWNGEGGILQRKEQLDASKPTSNSFTNWAKFTPEQNKLVNAILQTKLHLVTTMRSKTEYALSKNEQGKQAPQKVGLAPVQREGFDYEFDVVLDITQNHYATSTKDRSGIFSDSEPFIISEKVGEALRDWLGKGEAPEPVIPTPAPVAQTKAAASKPVTKAQAPAKPVAQRVQVPGLVTIENREEMNAAVRKNGWEVDDVKALLKMFGFNTSYDVTIEKFPEIMELLNQGPGDPPPPSSTAPAVEDNIPY